MVTFSFVRSIDRKTLERFQVREGEHGTPPRPALIFPTATGKQRVKYLDGEKPKAGWIGTGGRAHWYGLPAALEVLKGERLYIVNGEPSVWAAAQAGVPAVCSAAGELAPGTDMILELAKADVERVAVVFDRDSAGRKGARAAVEALRAGGLDAVALELPAELGPGGDVDDLHRRVGDDKLWFELEALPELQDEESRAKPAAQGWPDLAPLHRELPEPEELPLEALGPVLKPAADAIIRVIQVPAPAAVSTVLAAAAAAVQPHADVVVDGRTCPTSMFFLSVLGSGERKTAADRAALSPHHDHGKVETETYRGELHDYRCKLDAWKKSRDAAVAGTKKTYAEREAGLQALGPEPDPPMSPHGFVEEPTYEGLVKLLTIRPTVNLFTSEAARIIGGNAMSQDNRLKTLGGLTSAWDGQPISRSRAGDGTSVLYGRRVSMHLMCQPLVSVELLGDRMADDQGFLARCCICQPPSALGLRTYVEANVTTEPGWADYRARMLALLRRPLPLGEGSDPYELRPVALELNSKAKSLYLDFQRWKESHLKPGGELRQSPAWAERAPEHALRFAGVLSVVADPDTHEVDAASMENGIRWASYYLSESIRLRDVAATSAELQDAGALLLWIQSQGSRLVSLVDLYQRGPRIVRDRKTASKLMEALTEHGYLREVKGGAEVNGRMRRDVFELRPEGT
jgi:hypothetical protein